MRKLLWIVNPKSGNGELREDMLDCLDVFAKAGFETTVYITQAVGDAKAFAAENANRFDRIVCSGGDGTLDEVVNGLMECGSPPPLGYIPAGTTNDFATSLSIPKYAEDAAKIAAGENYFKLDIGQFNERYFAYIAAFGAFTDVSYTTKQPYKNLFGHAAYVLEGIRSLPFIKHYKIKISCDQLETEDEFIYGMVTNSTKVGGIIDVTRENVEMDDGLFEVILIRRPENALQLQGIINMLLQQDMSSELIYHFKTSSISFEMEKEMKWTLDGEFGGKPKQAVITNKKQALSLLVGQAQE